MKSMLDHPKDTKRVFSTSDLIKLSISATVLKVKWDRKRKKKQVRAYTFFLKESFVFVFVLFCFVFFLALSLIRIWIGLVLQRERILVSPGFATMQSCEFNFPRTMDSSVVKLRGRTRVLLKFLLPSNFYILGKKILSHCIREQEWLIL